MTPDVLQEEVLRGIQRKTPRGPTEGIPKGFPGGILQRISAETPEETPGGIYDQIPGKTAEGITD